MEDFWFNKLGVLVYNHILRSITCQLIMVILISLISRMLRVYMFLAVFIDLSKAFDTILLHKLFNYSICGNSHDIIQSYLSDRHQRVKIDNQISDDLLVKFGVPQDSALEPLYINDLHQLCIGKKHIKFILYAGGTNNFVACDCISEAASIT